MNYAIILYTAMPSGLVFGTREEAENAHNACKLPREWHVEMTMQPVTVRLLFDGENHVLETMPGFSAAVRSRFYPDQILAEARIRQPASNMLVTVTKRERYPDDPKADWHAVLMGVEGVWAAGKSYKEALGDLLLHHQETFGITIRGE